MPKPHFILIPFMAQGHQIPMIDMARLLSSHGVIVTIVTTPQNSIRFNPIVDRAVESGLDIRILRLRFPSTEAGLPEGCESLDTVPSKSLSENFMRATKLIEPELSRFISESAEPRPISCVVSDRYLPWTSRLARKFGVPRIVFDGTNCFNFVCTHNIRVSKIQSRVSSLFEPFIVPNLPDKIELTRAQLCETLESNSEFVLEILAEIDEADETAFGLVINTFEGIEKEYLSEARKILSPHKVWAIGPLSLVNEDKLDMSFRGNKSTVDDNELLTWLDTWPKSSVIYVCLGTLGVLNPRQMLEIGLALEASNRPFLWVIKGSNSQNGVYAGENDDELEEMISKNGLEDRTKERGRLVRGWAPQILILSHESIGGFLTHCGWNSTLEGISSGVPMLTWPMFSDQFVNERLVTQVLGVGVRVGVDRAIWLGQKESDVAFCMKSCDEIRVGIERVMGVGDEQEERRKRAKEIKERAKKAIEKDYGSSFSDLSLMIEDVMQHLNSTIYSSQ